MFRHAEKRIGKPQIVGRAGKLKIKMNLPVTNTFPKRLETAAGFIISLFTEETLFQTNATVRSLRRRSIPDSG